SHRPRIRVVHLAPQHAPAPGAALGRGETAPHRLGHAGRAVAEPQEARVDEAERGEDALGAVQVERLLRYLLDERSEQDEVEIAVDGRLARRVDQCRPADALEDGLPRRRRAEQPLALLALALEQHLVEGTPWPEPGAVRQKVPQRDRLLAA